MQPGLSGAAIARKQTATWRARSSGCTAEVSTRFELPAIRNDFDPDQAFVNSLLRDALG